MIAIGLKCKIIKQMTNVIIIIIIIIRLLTHLASFNRRIISAERSTYAIYTKY